MDRRQFMIGTTASAAAFAAAPALAQEAFPTHAITILNAFPPGGINDIVTRPFAATLEPILKQPVVVETKAGAGGQVGAQVAASAKPDGYTLLSHNNGISGYEDGGRNAGELSRHAESGPLAAQGPVKVMAHLGFPGRLRTEPRRAVAGRNRRRIQRGPWGTGRGW